MTSASWRIRAGRKQHRTRLFERQYTLEALKRQQDKIDQGQSRTGQSTVITDPVTGEKTTFVFQNSDQIIPLNKSKVTRRRP